MVCDEADRRQKTSIQCEVTGTSRHGVLGAVRRVDNSYTPFNLFHTTMLIFVEFEVEFGGWPLAY